MKLTECRLAAGCTLRGSHCRRTSRQLRECCLRSTVLPMTTDLPAAANQRQRQPQGGHPADRSVPYGPPAVEPAHILMKLRRDHIGRLTWHLDIATDSPWLAPVHPCVSVLVGHASCRRELASTLLRFLVRSAACDAIFPTPKSIAGASWAVIAADLSNSNTRR